MQFQFLDWEDSLEEDMATYSSILSRRIPKDRGAWQATVPGVARVGHNLATKSPLIFCPLCLPGKKQREKSDFGM